MTYLYLSERLGLLNVYIMTSLSRENSVDSANILQQSILKTGSTIGTHLQNLTDREFSVVDDSQLLEERAMSFKRRESRLVTYADELTNRKKRIHETHLRHSAANDDSNRRIDDEERHVVIQFNAYDKRSHDLGKYIRKTQEQTDEMRSTLADLEEKEQKEEEQEMVEMFFDTKITTNCRLMRARVEKARETIGEVDAEIAVEERKIAGMKLDSVERKAKIVRVEQEELKLRREVITLEQKTLSLVEIIQSKISAAKAIQRKYEESRNQAERMGKRIEEVKPKMEARMEKLESSIVQTRESVVKLRMQIDAEMSDTKYMNDRGMQARIDLGMFGKKHMRRTNKWAKALDDVKMKRKTAEGKIRIFKRREAALAKIESRRKEEIVQLKNKLESCRKCRNLLRDADVKIAEKKDAKEGNQRQFDREFMFNTEVLRELYQEIADAERVWNSFNTPRVTEMPMLGKEDIEKTKTDSDTDEQIQTTKVELRDLKREIRREEERLRVVRLEATRLVEDADYATGVLRMMRVRTGLSQETLAIQKGKDTERLHRDMSYVETRIAELSDIVKIRRAMIAEKVAALERVSRHYCLPAPAYIHRAIY